MGPQNDERNAAVGQLILLIESREEMVDDSKLWCRPSFYSQVWMSHRSSSFFHFFFFTQATTKNELNSPIKFIAPTPPGVSWHVLEHWVPLQKVLFHHHAPKPHQDHILVL